MKGMKAIGKVGEDRYVLEGGMVTLEDNTAAAFGHKEEQFEN